MTGRDRGWLLAGIALGLAAGVATFVVSVVAIGKYLDWPHEPNEGNRHDRPRRPPRA